MDLGGIATIAVNKRFVVRYEFGDTIVFYGRRNPLVGAPAGPGFTSHNLQLATGFAVRF